MPKMTPGNIAIPENGSAGATPYGTSEHKTKTAADRRNRWKMLMAAEL
jgi:hypothetical protein